MGLLLLNFLLLLIGLFLLFNQTGLGLSLSLEEPVGQYFGSEFHVQHNAWLGEGPSLSLDGGGAGGTEEEHDGEWSVFHFWFKEYLFIFIEIEIGNLIFIK